MFKTNSTGSMVMESEVRENTFISYFPKLVDFEANFRLENEEQSIKTRIKNKFKERLKKCDLKRSLLQHFPVIDTFAHYKVKEYLPNDMVAGIVAGVMMIPQGMAFAALSTLPPIVGLYISLFASLTYFFLGTGRQLSWGCIAILSLMMADILDKYDSSDKAISFISLVNASHGAGAEFGNSTEERDITQAIIDRRIEVASGVTVVVGLILVVASRIGLSRITALMSNSLITGFTVGISFHVATSQLKGLFGLTIPRYHGIGQLIKTWFAILEHLGETNVAVLIISVICILIIYLVKKFVNERYKHRMKVPIPIELFVVIISILVSYYLHFNEEYDVPIVKTVPTGIRKPKVPDFTLVADYIGDALVIIIVSFAQSLAMAKTMGLKHNYVIHSNQEMLACGVCSVVCGLFSGYITGASVSRSVVQDGAGAKTQVASLFAAALVLLVIMVMGPYFYHLPTCVLSAIIVVNLRTMFLKLLLIPQEWRKSRYDCAVWIFACLATIILNAALGLLASVIFALFLVVFRSMINPVEEVGQIQTNSRDVQLRTIENYTSLQKLPAVKLIKIKTPLYFFNSDTFTSAVYQKTQLNPLDIKKLKAKEQANSKAKDDHDLHNGKTTLHDNEEEKNERSFLICMKILIIDLSEVAFIDVMGIAALEFIITEYGSIGIEVLMTSVPENLFHILQSTGFWKKHGDRLFLTVEAALASLAATVENQEVAERGV